MSTDTKLDKLVLNVLTKSQVPAQPSANEQWFITDDDYFATKEDLDTKQPVGDYATNTALTQGLATKQDVINDLSTIRSNASAGKSASDTIAGYGDIVTHNANEFATTGALNGKQDKLTAGQNITIVDNVISSTGGGATITIVDWSK